MITRQDIIEMGYAQGCGWFADAIQGVNAQEWDITATDYKSKVLKMIQFYADGGMIAMQLYVDVNSDELDDELDSDELDELEFEINDDGA